MLCLGPLSQRARPCRPPFQNVRVRSVEPDKTQMPTPSAKRSEHGNTPETLYIFAGLRYFRPLGSGRGDVAASGALTVFCGHVEIYISASWMYGCAFSQVEFFKTDPCKVNTTYCPCCAYACHIPLKAPTPCYGPLIRNPYIPTIYAIYKK